MNIKRRGNATLETVKAKLAALENMYGGSLEHFIGLERSKQRVHENDLIQWVFLAEQHEALQEWQKPSAYLRQIEAEPAYQDGVNSELALVA